jgi:hypothetical protein
MTSIEKMFPMMMKPPQKEYIPHEYKLPLRVAGFLAAAVAIWQFGEKFELPESPRFA